MPLRYLRRIGCSGSLRRLICLRLRDHVVDATRQLPQQLRGLLLAFSAQILERVAIVDLAHCGVERIAQLSLYLVLVQGKSDVGDPPHRGRTVRALGRTLPDQRLDTLDRRRKIGEFAGRESRWPRRFLDRGVNAPNRSEWVSRHRYYTTSAPIDDTRAGCRLSMGSAHPDLVPQTNLGRERMSSM